MKRKLAITLVVILSMITTTILTGCGSVYEYEDMSQYITVGEYKGLEYDKSKLDVTSDEVKQAIDAAVSASAKTEDVTEGEVADGDTVIIDYVGTINGEEFEGGSAENQQLVIGSKSFIDGFETGLIGKKIGDTVSLDLKFPDTYQKEDLAGKDVNFKVTIKKKTQTITPTYNVEWVKENSQYQTTAEYETYVKDTLTKNKKIQVGTEMISNLAQKAKIDSYPEKELKLIVQSYKIQMQEQATQNNITLEDMMKQYGCNTEEDFDKYLEEQAKTQQAQEMVAYSIAKAENLVADAKSVDEYYDNFLKENNMSEEDFEKNAGMSLSQYKSEHDIDLQKALTSQNVAIFLVDNGKAK